MEILTIITAIAIAASLIADLLKTWEGIKKGLMMFIKILPAILSVLILISIFLYLLPNEIIVEYLGEDAGLTGYVFAAIAGSIALIPGFIAYPLAGILVKTGVSYPVIAVFITTLMMVGILTLPVEIKFFGIRASLIRNTFYFLGAIIIGFLIGLFYIL
ncbi:hypothetical protein [Draconibacterium sediminis]|uniref:hypothetical protein n=1 Tax=Draconibacterium sediminis TaxID=1544798 RepID=UPI0026EDE6F9|nr:hypothetical protein [Draconibacterium sediminis]